MNVGLKTRIGLGHGVLVAALLLVIAVTLWAFQVAREQTARVHDNFIPSLDAAHSLLVSLEQMENAEFMYFASGQDATDWMRRFDASASAFTAGMARAEGLVSSAREREIFQLIGQHYGAFLHVDQRMRTFTRSGRVAQARLLNTTESLQVAAQLRTTTQAFYDFNLAESERARETEDRTLALTAAVAVGIGVSGALLAGLLWWRMGRDIVEPLSALQAATGQLIRDGFAEARHPAAGRTWEIKALETDFNRMARELKAASDGLQAANDSLESQVAERTLSLQAANAKLAQLVDELRALDKLKSDFMSVMSHELLTPINFITGYGSLVEDEMLGPINPEQREALAKMTEGAERLTRMVRNTLEYTQLESGRLLIVPGEADYEAVVRQVADGFGEILAARHQPLSLELPTELPLAWADPHRAGQALAELLDNASKFSPEGRPITLRVSETPDWIVTELIDRGLGIPAAALPSLFTPFYQADASSTRVHGGLGLGLAIASRLITQMGGTLVATSQLGRGSAFQFTLPRAARQAKRPEPPVQSGDVRGHS